MPVPTGSRHIVAFLTVMILPLLLDGSTDAVSGRLDAYLQLGKKDQVVDRAAFFKKVRGSFHRKGLKDVQVSTYNAILDYWDEHPRLVDSRWLAYVLGTALHESGSRMAPVREALGKTDDQTIARLDRSGGIYAKLRRKGKTFWRRQPKHGNRAYFGRGLIQITHAYNYKRMGREIGIGDELYLNPSLALDPDIAVKVLYIGMVKGLYRSDKRGAHSLARYFSPKLKGNRQWIRARNIVNGGYFHADQIAAKAKKYLRSIKHIPAGSRPAAVEEKSKKPETVKPEVAPVGDPNAIADAREQELVAKDLALDAARSEVERLKKNLRAKDFALDETRRTLDNARAEIETQKVAIAAVPAQTDDTAAAMARLEEERQRLVAEDNQRRATAEKERLAAIEALARVKDEELRSQLEIARVEREKLVQDGLSRQQDLNQAVSREKLARQRVEQKLAMLESQQTPITEEMVRQAVRFEFSALIEELRGLNAALGDLQNDVRDVREEEKAALLAANPPKKPGLLKRTIQKVKKKIGKE